MTFNSMSLMTVERITLYKTKELDKTGSYVRHIEIKHADGSCFDIAIHSDTPLEIEDEI